MSLTMAVPREKFRTVSEEIRGDRVAQLHAYLGYPTPDYFSLSELEGVRTYLVIVCSVLYRWEALAAARAPLSARTTDSTAVAHVAAQDPGLEG